MKVQFFFHLTKLSKTSLTIYPQILWLLLQQAKLLRVLENGEFLKVGYTKTTKVNVRIIAATNRNLRKEVETNHFREDLFYRISVFQIELTPLRERTIDIEEIANHFLTVFSNKTNKRVSGFSKTYIDSLKSHEWRGNIRELKNVIERSVILSTADVLDIYSLSGDFQKIQLENSKGKTLSAFDLASAEKIHIQKVLNYTNGNKTETARLLNIALTTLYRKLEEYKIS